MKSSHHLHLHPSSEDPFPRLIAEKADEANKHVHASARAAAEKAMHEKLTTGCLQCSFAAAVRLFIPYLLQVKSGPMAMNCTPEGHQLKLGTSKEAKKGKGLWLLDCYGTGECWKTLTLAYLKKKKQNTNKLRNNAVATIYLWLPEHARVPQVTEVTMERAAGQPMLPPNQSHRQAYNVLEKLLLAGREVLGENRAETHQSQFCISNRTQPLC